MDGNIITALIAFLGTVIGSLGGVLAAARLTNFRLQQLEKKVEKHNNLVERVAIVEQRSKSNQHRLDDIEHSHV